MNASHLDGRTVTVPSTTAGHNDHNVSIRQSARDGAAGPAGTLYLVCDCGAGRNYFANLARGRFAPCYAMRSVASVYAIVLPRRDYRGIGR